jgi:molybdenum cofactor biosynthesis enzyme MoaA
VAVSTPPGPLTATTAIRLGRAHRRAGVRLRREAFGALAYVPDLDRFFALDVAAADLVESLAAGRPVDDREWSTVVRLARAGIVDTQPVTECSPGSGRSLIGSGLPDLPEPAEPMVVNCFVTAHCPLRCRYCHADDLMQPFRTEESDSDLERVTATAAAIPAMVAVITGGDPIVSPDRAARLIAGLAPEKAIVVDTSGAGDIVPLLPVLKEHHGHLRVSVDSAEAALHDRVRPINRRYLGRDTSSHAAALSTVERAVAADVPTTVQTVVSRTNEDEVLLMSLAYRLRDAGARNWVLHVAVPAGKAAVARNRRVLPTGGVSDVLSTVKRRIEAELIGLRVRVTATHANPDAVVLVGSRGDVYVQTGTAGKLRVAAAGMGRDHLAEVFRTGVDLRAHADRYLGGTAPFAGEPDQVSAGAEAAEAT